MTVAPSRLAEHIAATLDGSRYEGEVNRRMRASAKGTIVAVDFINEDGEVVTGAFILAVISAPVIP